MKSPESSDIRFNNPVYTAELSGSNSINAKLLKRYLTVNELEDTHKTHHFMGRFENTYISVEQVPELAVVINRLQNIVSQILQRPAAQLEMGFWFNEMHPGHKTSLHTHGENNELLSAVYYVTAPKDSGNLVVKSNNQIMEFEPVAGRFYLFRPEVPHSVNENLSQSMRLSVAFNFGLPADLNNDSM